FFALPPVYPFVSLFSLHDALPIFRFGLDALRAMALPVRERGASGVLLSRRLHLGGHGPDTGMVLHADGDRRVREGNGALQARARDRKSTRLNSSHDQISYAVFCLK